MNIKSFMLIVVGAAVGLVILQVYLCSRRDNIPRLTSAENLSLGNTTEKEYQMIVGVTPEQLTQAGFQVDRGDIDHPGYTHPRITLGELSRVLNFRIEDMQEIPNTPPGTPITTVEFHGGCL